MRFPLLAPAIIAFIAHIAVTTAFSVSLTCNDPCGDLMKDGIPADGVISANWDGPELRQDTPLIFSLKWGSKYGESDYGLLYDLKPENGEDVYVANESSILQIPPVYHPPGDQYYITVYPSNRRDLSQGFGPFKLNDAYDTYPVPTPSLESNFTVTLEYPSNSPGNDSSNTTYHLGQEITVKWTNLPRNVTYNLTAVQYYWGNPATYGDNSTRWNGNMGAGDGPSVGLTQTEAPFILDDMAYPPPGDSYYIGVLLGDGRQNYEYAMNVKVVAYAGPITIARNSSSSTGDDSESLSPELGPVLYTIMSGLFASLGSMYY
ncbi:hypothetical protein BJV82DRAFT_623744, partial [Fennellomyces sp. T-0311]